MWPGVPLVERVTVSFNEKGFHAEAQFAITGR